MVTKNQVVSERIDTTHKYTLATVAATSAVAEAVTIVSHKIDENQQQQQQNPVEVKNEQLLETSGSSSMETEQHYLPKASEPPQVIIIPATQASTVATNAAKKIRRAFSMPRNPFRWSRKFKTSTPINSTSVGATDGGERNSTIITSCVSGERENAGSTISLNGDYQAVGKQANDANDEFHEKGNNSLNSLPNDRNILTNCISNNKQQISNNNNNKNINTESGGNRVIRRSSLRKFLNRIAQHVSSTVNVGVSYIHHFN